MIDKMSTNELYSDSSPWL